ncbi:MAG: 2-C-methyl-D-erythritol 2,4-cyclodiphosphate synthase [Ginsengibacter sp.]
MSFRIGFGIDFHQLVTGRELWLGGVNLPHDKGALGHSDADVLLHSICDALLGAACLGDIGVHFPDTSDEFKNIDSKILLQKTFLLIQNAGYRIGNIDSTICIEKPKVQPYIPAMRKVISELLSIEENAVSIKATTSEKMGFVGRGEGVAAYATTLIESINKPK